MLYMTCHTKLKAGTYASAGQGAGVRMELRMLMAFSTSGTWVMSMLRRPDSSSRRRQVKGFWPA